MNFNIIIDARSNNSGIQLYSISMLERLLRQIHEIGLNEAVVLLHPDYQPEFFFRRDFHKRFKMNLRFISAPSFDWNNNREKIKPLFPFLFLEADALYDERIIKNLIESTGNIIIYDKQSLSSPLALRLESEAAERFIRHKGDFSSWNNQKDNSLQLQRISVHEMSTYIRFIRRHVNPYLRRIDSKTNLKELENEMYTNTFKGGMELVATYGYRIPVRELTRLCARWNISPNQVTAWSVIAKIGAIPAFFLGWYYTGLLLAILFIIFDSLDGKLARMTVRYSKAADRWDHLTSLPARMGWFLGMGWFFSGGNFGDLSAIAAIILAVTNFADKMVFNIFNSVFGRSPLDFTEFDRTINLFNVKRNDVFLIFILSLFGFALESFYFVTIWTLLFFFWRVARTLWLRFYALSMKLSQ